MKAKQYIFLNKGLGMSTGKSAAQAGHAAVEGVLISPRDEVWDAWREGLHYAKYVCECRDTEHLLATERYLNDRGFKTVLIIDEGRTEVDPLTPTALGVQLVDGDDPHTKATFSSFKLYKDDEPQDAASALPKTMTTTDSMGRPLSNPSVADGFPPAITPTTIFGYPVTLNLHMTRDTVSVTQALKYDHKTGLLKVDLDTLLDKVADAQQRGRY